ncbi:hypothetical protein [Marinobacter similis]|uniref:hypothetical protein n=1 Tax=Marinobacter similis TaxID=1420916 RepID=UPI001F24EBF4|nr:hypothetical protein [Marinobacter similis]
MNDRLAPLKSSLLTGLGLVVLAVLLILNSRPILGDETSDDNLVVSIGVVADSKPYSFFEGRSTSGFSADILKEIAANSGWSLNSAPETGLSFTPPS